MPQSVRIIIYVALALIFVATNAVAYLLYKYAIPRKGLQFQYKNRKKSAEPKTDNGWSAAMPKINAGIEYFHSLPHEDVYITSYDGLKLHGYYFTTPNAKRTLLAVHGFRSHPHNDFGYSLKFYLQSGCNVLAIDQRSHNDSEGKHLTFGVKERFDCRDWAVWLDENHGGLPIYPAGVSMGCATVLMASGLTLPDSVRGIIADCGYTSPWEEFCHVLKTNFRLPKFPFMPLCRLWVRILGGFDIKGYSTLDAMKVNTRPILFFHGGKDDFVPTEMGRRNYAACRAPKKLIIVEQAAHALSYITQTQRYESEATAFFAENDTQKGNL